MFTPPAASFYLRHKVAWLPEPSSLSFTPVTMTCGRALALAVLEKAVSDARGTSTYCSTAHRAMARAWLTFGEDLRFWCEPAGVDVDEVRRRSVNQRRSTRSE